MTRPRRYCAGCATPLPKGTYIRCPQGCGALLCKKGRRACRKDHTRNCIVYQIQHGIEEAS
ncbi:hypothetical protein [Streptomyces sp. NPDC005283]|uniref:hypothetical protein n=1 Tax=Streptomyces sp. NPDC005283 TaxID=3156871 RepID=UPI0034562878